MRRNESRVVAIIPARLASSRFPGKILAPLDGHPMIEWVYRRAAQARRVDRVLVAADDKQVVRTVENFGGEAILTSRTHRSGTDRLAEVARQMRCDLVVNVQGDEPLIDPDTIDATIEVFLHRRAPSFFVSTAKTRIRSSEELVDPHVVKVLTNVENEALWFSRAPIPHVRYLRLENVNFSTQKIFFKHLGLYVYQRDFLLRFSRWKPTRLEQLESLEQLRVLENGYKIKVVETRHDSISVDTPEGLARAEEEIRRRKLMLK